MGASAPFFLLMASISYGASTELDAVNSILMSVGESPVNNITNVQSPEVVIAHKTLQQVCREVLAEGWVFNTETEYPIDLDANKHCVVPDNPLQIDTNDYKHHGDYHVVQRKHNGINKLYNIYKHTFEFENLNEDKLYCDIIWMYEFENIPQVFRDYITLRATRVASNRMVNNPQSAELIGVDEQLARGKAVEYDTSQSDLSIFNNERGRSNPNSVYRPYQVLQR